MQFFSNRNNVSIVVSSWLNFFPIEILNHFVSVNRGIGKLQSPQSHILPCSTSNVNSLSLPILMPLLFPDLNYFQKKNFSFYQKDTVP